MRIGSVLPSLLGTSGSSTHFSAYVEYARV
jgi:hypothetical protein